MTNDDPETDADDPPDVETLLDRAGFDADRSVLTTRQAEVLALRERGLSQGTIAGRLGTSRANVSGIERSARENVERARETVAFAEALTAPVRIRVDPGTDLFDVPRQVYRSCDEADLKVAHTEPELVTLLTDRAGDAVRGREVRTPLLVSVTEDGRVRVRRALSAAYAGDHTGGTGATHPDAEEDAPDAAADDHTDT